MALTNVPVAQTWTITGNDDMTNDIASIAEMQVKEILDNNEDMLFMRGDATAKSIIQMGAMGTAIYRTPVRGVFGTDYDLNEGIKRQRNGSLEATVRMDQHLTVEFMWEDFDMTRYMEADPDVRASLLGEWLKSIMKSYLLSLEAIFIRGVVDYSIAKANKYPSQLMQVDPSTITDEKSARAFYGKIRTVVNKWKQMFTQTAMGLNPNQVKIAMSPNLYTAVTLNLPNFILNEETFRVLETGELHANTIMGVAVREHSMLNNHFKKEDGSLINKDIDFDFDNVHLIMYIDDMWVMPLGMEKSETIKDNKTLNPKLISKNMGSLPEALRTGYTLVGLSTLPDQPTILQKQALKADGQTYDYSKSFQLAEYDQDFGTAPSKGN